MQLLSPAFKNNDFLPSKYTCDGEGINPALQISGTPNNAQSLVLVVEDPDAPVGTFIHWTVWSFRPDLSEIAENLIPSEVVQGITSLGKTGYVPPCPPSGTHRYIFKIFALDTTLTLSSNANIRQLTEAMKGHILDSGELIGKYKRG